MPPSTSQASQNRRTRPGSGHAGGAGRATHANGAGKRTIPPHRPDPDEENYYQLLNVPYTANQAEIIRAYRQAMKRSHPDRVHPERRAAAEDIAKLLNRAYATLTDPIKRRDYDASIRATEVQDQLMRRYVGGFAGPGIGSNDPFAQALRREPTTRERAERRRADHSAMFSLVTIFVVATGAVIAVLLIWALLASLIGWLV